MNLQELKEKIQEYQYLESSDVIDVALSSILCTRLSLGAPVWLTIIGASSGGKTQILRPLGMTDEKFIHSVDNLTPNTLLSGANVGKGQEPSLLKRIGSKGIVLISDMTVLFTNEEKDAILGALRTIYDGYYTRHVGNKGEALTWTGQLGIIAGSTPSIYSHFEEVADMGERFLYYRMKDFNSEKATEIAMNRKIFGKELNQKLSGFYTEYLKGVIEWSLENPILPELPPEVIKRIIKIAQLAERIRTTSHVDWQRVMDRLPVPAYPMRASQQLRSIARGLQIMRLAEGSNIGQADLKILDWIGWSLANEEKRACLKYLAELPFTDYIKTQTVADLVGLNTSVIQTILQNLSAIGVLKRSGSADGLKWKIASEDDWKLIREIEGIVEEKPVEAEREISAEEPEQAQQAIDDFMGGGWNKD